MNARRFGSIVAAACLAMVMLDSSAHAYLGVARYTTTGYLDPAFNGGEVIVAEPFLSGYNDVVMSGDKTVAAGFFVANSAIRVLVGRYLSNGAGDPTFGWLGGTTITFNPSRNEEAVSVALDGSRVIVLARSPTENANNTPFLARFNSNGSFDSTFGRASGFTTTADAQPLAVAKSKDGNLVILTRGGSGTGIRVERMNATATTTLWTATPSFESGLSGSLPTDLVTDSSNRILVVGASPSGQVGVLRMIGATGALDGGFGTGGRQLLGGATPPKCGTDIAIDLSGRILVVGRHLSSNDTNVLIYRLNGTTGAPTNGATYGFGETWADFYWSVAAAGNNFYVAGTVWSGGGSHFAIAKLSGWTFTQDSTFGNAGQTLTPLGEWGPVLAGLAVESSTGKATAVGGTPWSW